MSLFGSLKDFFLPSEEVSAARRLDTFGTESKAIAGTVIVGTAVALIAAPPLIARAGGISGVAGSVGRALSTLPLKDKIVLGGATAIAAPIIAGQVVREPKTITRSVGGAANFESNLYQASRDPSKQNIKDIFLENPVISTGVAALGLLAVGGGVAGAIATARNTAAINENTQSMIGSVPSVPGSSAPLPVEVITSDDESGPSSTPLTPQTQVLGREVTGSGNRSRRSPRKKAAASSSNVRVNILNQQTYIGGR